MADSHFRLRIPDEIKAEIEQSALANRRSINAEVIYRLGVEHPTMRGANDVAAEPKNLKANIAPFGLRMQPDLKMQIEAAAEANERSINSEIVARLQSTFRHSLPSTEANDAGDLANALHALADRIAKLGEGA